MCPEIAYSAGCEGGAGAASTRRAPGRGGGGARGAASTYRAGVSSVCNQTQCKLTHREPAAHRVPARRH